METKATHTPGPWEQREKGLGDAPSGTFVGKVGSGLVARCFTNLPNMPESECHDMARANARLIAAAPDLLEALVELTDSMETAHGEWAHRCTADCPDMHKRLQRARAAIEKATGDRSPCSRA